VIKLGHPIIDSGDVAAVTDALTSGQVAQGPRVAAFEDAFAAYIGVRHAIAVNSGTAALHLALLAALGPPDPSSTLHSPAPRATHDDSTPEVIVPAFSFAATANVVLHAGARPVFVDVRADDFNIDPDGCEAAITPRTRAIIPVHLYGQPCDISTIRAMCDARDIALIEDAAQAIGASAGDEKCGAAGTGAFSFYATKNLQTGEGGMITTDDDAVAESARTLRSQGERTRYVTEELGYNFRMTEIAAALGHAQLAKIDARNEQRRRNAARLTEMLAGNDAIVTPAELPGRRHVYHQYTLRVRAGREARDRLQAQLRERGIETGVFYPIPIHRQPLYRRLGYGELHLPVSEQLAGEVLSLPVHPALTDDDLDRIATAVDELTRAARVR